MSGSGGFYKYRCKYFYTNNCPNWVFVNNAPCAECCAAGRDIDDDELSAEPAPGRQPPPYLQQQPYQQNQNLQQQQQQQSYPLTFTDFEIRVPVFEDGLLRYVLMELSATVLPGSDFTSWSPRQTRAVAAASTSLPH